MALKSDLFRLVNAGTLVYLACNYYCNEDESKEEYIPEMGLQLLSAALNLYTDAFPGLVGDTGRTCLSVLGLFGNTFRLGSISAHLASGASSFSTSANVLMAFRAIAGGVHSGAVLLEDKPKMSGKQA